MIKLRELKLGEQAVVEKITAQNELGRRIRDLGIVKGAQIKVLGKAPLYDPVALKVNSSVLTLRNKEADFIFVSKKGNLNEGI